MTRVGIADTSGSFGSHTTLRGIWGLTPEARWTAVEQQLGKNLPSNFPVIDKFEHGIATSIKSMDIAAQTYSNPAAIARVGQGYIDKVAGFQGRNWANVDIRASQITGRSLDLAVPPGASGAHKQALQDLIRYGQQQGVRVNIVELH